MIKNSLNTVTEGMGFEDCNRTLHLPLNTYTHIYIYIKFRVSAQLERVFIPVYTLGFPFDLLGPKRRYGLSCQPMLKRA